MVNTAWAVLALLRADYHDKAAIRRGIDLLISRQLPNGDWVWKLHTFFFLPVVLPSLHMQASLID